MSRKSNLAVVEEVPIDDDRQTDIEQVAEETAAAQEPTTDSCEAPGVEVKTRKTRTPRAAFVAEEIEDDVPPPSRLIRYTLAELIGQIPVGKSRVIIGTKTSAVERAAKAFGVEVISSDLEGRPGDVRVWRL